MYIYLFVVRLNSDTGWSKINDDAGVKKIRGKNYGLGTFLLINLKPATPIFFDGIFLERVGDSDKQTPKLCSGKLVLNASP